jgi:hypothetical protein
MLALLCLFTAIALLGVSLWLRRKGGRAEGWPSVTGKILDAFVDTADRESMRPVVRYQYRVGNSDLEGWRVSFKGFGTSEASMKKYIAGYKPNATVRVYYNPADPRESVLDNSDTGQWKRWLVAGLALLLLTAYLTYWS